MHNSDIVVSIICNTYNHENYITHALESFLEQKTKFKFEILIHDDASTDATPTIIKKFAKRYPDIIKPILQTENQMSQGINVSKTFQYARAKGKYLAFCEGDDYWIDPNKLQLQVDWLEAHPRDIGCVHKYIVVDENENEKKIKTFGYYEKEGTYTLHDFETQELPSQLASLVCRNIFCTPGLAYPNKFDDVKIQGDIKLYLYLLAHGSIYRLSSVCSAYRFVYCKGGQSWSSRQIGIVKGYKDWKELKKLEKIFSEIYGKKISLYMRICNSAADAVINCMSHPSYTNLKNALIVIVHQPECIYLVIKRIVTKIQNIGKGGFC